MWSHPLIDNAHVDHWSWNPKEKSKYVELKGPNNITARIHPEWSNCTAGVRGTRVLNGGKYYWEVSANHLEGTSTMFGIGTAKAPLTNDTFNNMIGHTCAQVRGSRGG